MRQLLMVAAVAASIGFIVGSSWADVSALTTILGIFVILAAVGLWHLIEGKHKVAISRQQEDRLQMYFDRMTELLINRGLRESEEGSEVRAIARTLTLSVLRQLDPEEKALVLKFLYDSKLINNNSAVLNLSEADFSSADLTAARLTNANLAEANFQDARLLSADLRATNLARAYLVGANLAIAQLEDANLTLAFMSKTYLVGTRFEGANLTKTILDGANLHRAEILQGQLDQVHSLKGAILPDGSTYF